MLTSMAVACLRRLPRRTARNIVKSVPFVHDIEVDGIKLRCHPHDNVTERELMLDPTAEREAIDLVLAELGAGGTFVDIGANCGVYSLFAARQVGPAGRVVAIEPIP
jgi:hypothetical protein